MFSVQGEKGTINLNRRKSLKSWRFGFGGHLRDYTYAVEQNTTPVSSFCVRLWSDPRSPWEGAGVVPADQHSASQAGGH